MLAQSFVKSLTPTALIFGTVVGAALIQVAHAAPGAPTTPSMTPAPTAPPTAEPATGERLNVDKLKEKYWAKGDESELRVVQNRLYTKSLKLELGLFAGSISTDPFLKVQNAGLSLGFHFSDFWAITALAWR